MSCNYAEGLSHYEDKGVCGLPEKFEPKADVDRKIKQLVDLIKKSKHVVVHTGAGISTSAGIPDFRGPKGVWTLEQKGEKPNVNISFDDAIPTKTHMALLALKEKGYIHYIISQNVDGLHLRSGFPRNNLAELHGNIYIEQCDQCNRQFVRKTAVKTVGQKYLGAGCRALKPNKRPCRGKLHDNVLDWEDELPLDDLELSQWHAKHADLSICLGTTLQIVPSGNLPLLTKNKGGKLVICNLQPTKHDKHADLIIGTYVDDVIGKVAESLGCAIPSYSPEIDPTKQLKDSEEDKLLEWTISVWQTLDEEKPEERKPKKKIIYKKIKLENNENGSHRSSGAAEEIKKEDSPKKAEITSDSLNGNTKKMTEDQVTELKDNLQDDETHLKKEIVTEIKLEDQIAS